MTGVLLAGGEGSRLRPATHITNKHLQLVYDRPMIHYPIETLKAMGCSSITLVTGGEHIGDFTDYLKDGSELGVEISYRVQAKPGGIAQALGCVGKIEGLFPVILGDNYFSEAPKMPNQPTLYFKNVDDSRRFGVFDPDLVEIVEKPPNPPSSMAIVGLYVYDERVFDMIPELKPSDRNEVEITDINNIYLKLGAPVLKYSGYWSDMGTPDSLLRTANYIAKSEATC